MSVLVIGEPGCTAEGDHDTYIKLLETAKACGCDVWKPQWVSDPVQMCERRHIGPDHPKREFYLKAYSWLAFPVDWHAEFRDKCHALGMKYACTVFLPQDVATVAPLVDYLKIASFENADKQMQEACAQWEADEDWLIVSLGGLLSGRDRMAAIDAWLNCADAKFLHCVSAYPAPKEQANIAAVQWEQFDGYSDHTRHLLAGALAVASEAEIIETHYRLDTCHPSNPDYSVAFTPAEFTQYIQNIRDAEVMLGTGEKRRQPCEEWALPYRVTA